MRQFTQKGLRIDQLSLEAKLVYTAFCVLSLAALAVSVLYYYELVGSAPSEGVRAYYGGEAALPPDDGVSAPGGPDIALPDELEAPRPEKLVVPVTARKLLEVTHFHLFTVPVFLLILSHLFMLCRARPGVKVTVIAGASLAAMIHLAAPWLIFWSGGGWAWLMPVSGAAMTAAMLALIGWPLVGMWRSPPAS